MSMNTIMTLMTIKYSCYTRVYPSQAGKNLAHDGRCESDQHPFRNCRLLYDMHSGILVTSDHGKSRACPGSKIESMGRRQMNLRIVKSAVSEKYRRVWALLQPYLSLTRETWWLGPRPHKLHLSGRIEMGTERRRA